MNRQLEMSKVPEGILSEDEPKRLQILKMFSISPDKWGL